MPLKRLALATAILSATQAPHAMAATPAQVDAAQAVGTLAPSSSLAARIAALTPAQAAVASTELSGQIHADQISILQSLSTTTANIMLSQLRGSLESGQPTGPVADLNNTSTTGQPQPATLPVWTQIVGDWQDLKSGGERVHESDGGIFIGTDHEVAHSGWRLGGALGYVQGQTGTGQTKTLANTESYIASVYGGRSVDMGPGKLELLGGTAYSWHQMVIARTVTLPGDSQNPGTNYTAQATQVFGEVGWRLPFSQSTTVRPFLGMNWTDLRTPAFTEDGGDAALHSGGASSKVGTNTLGVNLDHAFNEGAMHGTFHTMLGWRHAYGDITPTLTESFADSSASFTSQGLPISRDALVASIGVDLAVSKRTTVGVSYGGQFGAHDMAQTAMMQVRIRF